jgi:hypothetical protein
MLAELKRRGIPVVLTGMLAAPNLGAKIMRKCFQWNISRSCRNNLARSCTRSFWMAW